MPFTDLDAWLNARAAADQFSGVVLIQHGQEAVFSGAYGWASRRWAVPNNLATRSDTASITEIVDLAGTAISPAVTVGHLLTHTSGIADDADEEAGESYEARGRQAGPLGRADAAPSSAGWE
jgi:CubicO group peptidase (beta-lactamase class C family)